MRKHCFCRVCSKVKDRAKISSFVKSLWTLHGIGTISADGSALAEASYFIEVSRDANGSTRSDGLIDAKLAALKRFSQSEEPGLTLETGEQVPIIVTRIESGHALIRILGPIPGLSLHDNVGSRDQFDLS